jgi:hypothetical protein
MHVLRKLTGCLSSTTCDNDETHPTEENISSTTTSILSRLSLIQDTTIEKKVNRNRDSRDIEQTTMITDE